MHVSYGRHYDLLMASGLYDSLAGRRWLIPHVEVPAHSDPTIHRTLHPEVVPFISYPYEWSFSQLKDAALLTLDIQLESLAFGMVLKDASAYNVQFIGSRPVFIDTLSFETYEEGRPWIAYRQFCQHFLGPLALMAYRDLRLRELLARFIDGPPLDLVAGLLPARTRFRYGLLAHLHAHARSQVRHAGEAVAHATRAPRLPKNRLVALMHSLRSAVQKCEPPSRRTEWSDYYDATNYSPEAMAAKESLVGRLVQHTAPAGGLVHDLGANTGRFSRLLAASGRTVIAHDLDDLAVERNYLASRSTGANVLPLVLNLANPSPALGWALEERASTLDRVAGSTVIALALVHHLAISNNVPLRDLAALFARMAQTLVIEFVPKEDSQVKRLLATRQDIFPNYSLEGFEAAFAEHFAITHRETVPGSARTLLAMRRPGGSTI